MNGAIQRMSAGEAPSVGKIVRMRQDRAYGWVAEVELLHGADRVTDARIVFPGGLYAPVSEGDRVLVLFLEGRADQAICIPQVAMGGDAKPPAEWVSDQDRARLVYGLTEVRGSGGDSVEGVLTRSFLDDLSSMLGDLVTIGISATALTPVVGIVSTLVDPPVPLASLPETDVATINGVKALLTNLGTTAASLKALVDLARIGQGTGPHCSDMLRAKAGS